jgi:tetratricopeptide (TPR) repeat protein
MRGLMAEGREQLERAISRATLHTMPTANVSSTLNTSRSKIKALNGASYLAWRQGDFTTAQRLAESALALGREVEDLPNIAFALNSLGIVAHEQGHYGAAQTLWEESLAVRRSIGDRAGTATSLNNLGLWAFGQEDYTRARTLLEESLTIASEVGDKYGRVLCLDNLGVLAAEQKDYTRARTLFEQSMAEAIELGDTKDVVATLAGLAGVEIATGQVEKGATLLGAVDGLLGSAGAVLDSMDRRPYDRHVEQARSLLGEEAFKRLLEKGREMSIEEATTYALENTPAGRR